MKTLTLAVVYIFFAANSVLAGQCHENAPEGYQWLDDYVVEFRTTGVISEWFQDSFKEHPRDYALLSLHHYFEAGGNFDVGLQTFTSGGGSPESYIDGLACAGVNSG